MSNQEAPAKAEKSLSPGEKLAAYLQAMDVGNRAFKNGDLDEARDAFAEAAALRPEMFQPHLMLGTVLRSQGDIIGALDAFQAALDLQPKNSDLLCQIGELLYANHLYEEALAVFSEAVIADDRYTTAICGLADVLSVMGQHDAACSLLRPAIEREPVRPELWSSMGTACHKAGDLENAVTFYEEALRLLPGIEPANSNLGLLKQASH